MWKRLNRPDVNAQVRTCSSSLTSRIVQRNSFLPCLAWIPSRKSLGMNDGLAPWHGNKIRSCFMHTTTVKYAKHHPPLVGEEENDDVLFENRQKKKLALVSGGSLAQLAFWVWQKGLDVYDPITPSIEHVVTHPMWSNVGLGLSAMFVGLVSFSAKRYIAKLTVLPGGEEMELTTHKFFGEYSEPRVVKVSDLVRYPISSKYISMKVKNDVGFYVFDLDSSAVVNVSRLEKFIAVNKENADEVENKDKNATLNKFPIQKDLPRTKIHYGKSFAKPAHRFLLSSPHGSVKHKQKQAQQQQQVKQEAEEEKRVKHKHKQVQPSAIAVAVDAAARSKKAQ